MAIIDLDRLINRTTTFKINDKKVEVKEVSIDMFKRMIKVEEKENALDEQINFVVEMLNNNINKIKFSKKEVEKLPKSALEKIWLTMLTQSVNTLEDPN